MAGPLPEPESTIERDRLAALESLHLLDTQEEERFDRITALAARLLDTPISLVSLVDRDRQWFKSHHGIAVRETPRVLSFCTVAIERDDLYVVEDARADPRWSSSGLVAGPPYMCAYAGEPLHGPGGFVIGTLNVIDLQPRHFTDDELDLLRTLGRFAEAELAVVQLGALGAQLDAARRDLEEANTRLSHAVRERTAELEASERRYRRLVEAAPDVIIEYELRPEPHLRFVSPALARLTGYTPAEALAAPDPIGLVVHPQDRPLLDEVLADPRRAGSRPLTLRWRHRDGSVVWTENRLVAIDDRDGEVVAVEGVARDVTDLRAAQAELAHRALHDQLTGLPNRSLFTEELARALRALERRHATVCVLFFDLDRFKVVNDSLGHQVGDQLLQAVALRVTAALRPADLIARLGGDEFAVLVTEVESSEVAVSVARRVLTTFERSFSVGSEEIYTSASIGIACTTDPDEVPEDLLRHADVAMYRAKAAGRARVELFDDALRHQLHERLRREGALHRALERDELRLRYQPIVDLAERRIVAVEALLRWCRPGGELAPGAFIELAEETGLIVPIGEWVLGQAARDAAGWHDPVTGTPLVVQVNLSARQLGSASLEDAVDRATADGLAPERLCLEITESVLMADSSRAVSVLARLREQGIGVAVDDFGTGYSSLAYLRRLPLDALKIDRAFVHDLDGTPPDDRLVEAITTMAHRLDLSVTAEGVETPRQLAAVRAAGCEHAQGFLIAHPATAAELPAAFASALLRSGTGPGS